MTKCLASCWNREFRYFEVKIEESEKAVSRRESNPEHKPGVLGLIPSDCRPFHFPLFSPQNI